MRTLPIPDETKLKIFDDVMALALGGHRVVEALVMFHEDRRTPQEIAELLKFNSRQHVEKLLEKSRENLCELGVWPAHWKTRYRSPGQKRTVNLETLHA